MKALRSEEWAWITGLLGAHGYPVMLELLLNHGLFVPALRGSGVRAMAQVSGTLITELEVRKGGGETGKQEKVVGLVSNFAGVVDGERAVARKPSDIRFVRHRMLYARSGLNSRGRIHYGLQQTRECPQHDSVKNG